MKDYSEIKIPPLCPKCGGIVRPDVVFFGEMLPDDKLKVLERELTRGFDSYFSIGTTSVFPYISQPMVLAKGLGQPTVEINPDETEVSCMVDIKLRMGAAEALDAIWREFGRPPEVDENAAAREAQQLDEPIGISRGSKSIPSTFCITQDGREYVAKNILKHG